MKTIYHFNISKSIDGVTFSAECLAIGNSLRISFKYPFKGLTYETHKWHYAGRLTKKDIKDFAYDELVATKCDFSDILHNQEYTEIMRLYKRYSRKLKCMSNSLEQISQNITEGDNDKPLLDFAISVLKHDKDEYYRTLCLNHKLAAIAPKLVEWHIKWMKRNPEQAKSIIKNTQTLQAKVLTK